MQAARAVWGTRVRARAGPAAPRSAAPASRTALPRPTLGGALRPRGRGRAEKAQPVVPGEGVSGGLGPGPLPVPLGTPPHAVLPGHGSVPQPLAVRGSAPSPMQSRLLLLRAPGGHGGPAARRLRLLLRQVVRGRPEVRLLHAGAGADTGDTVNIGDVSYKLKTPKSPELVPQNYSSIPLYGNCDGQVHVST